MQGATGLWQSWEFPGTPDSGGSSHNHPGLASVGAWLHKYVVGLRLDEPEAEEAILSTAAEAESSLGGKGWQRVIFSPEVVEDPRVVAASAAVVTLFGPVNASWRKGPEGLSMSIELPVNVQATVRIPGP